MAIVDEEGGMQFEDWLPAVSSKVGIYPIIPEKSSRAPVGLCNEQRQILTDWKVAYKCLTQNASGFHFFTCWLDTFPELSMMAVHVES